MVFLETKWSAYEKSDESQLYRQLLGFGEETAVTKEPGIYCKIFAKEHRIFAWTRRQAAAAIEKQKSLLPNVTPSEHWTVQWPGSQ